MPQPFTRLARLRAHDLLAGLLTDAEYAQLIADDYLEVRSPSTPRRVYRVPAHGGQVTVYQDGHAVVRLCIGPARTLPEDDVIALHKLMIEGNESEYLRQANHFPVPDLDLLRLRQRQLHALFPLAQ
jgi:hypothetical protein